MCKKLMTLVLTSVVTLLMLTSTAFGTSEGAKKETLLTSPHVIVGAVTPKGEKPMVVVVIRGKVARDLKKQCECDSVAYPELNLVILLDCDTEI